jgi:S1-C subfamily serine protease
MSDETPEPVGATGEAPTQPSSPAPPPPASGARAPLHVPRWVAAVVAAVVLVGAGFGIGWVAAPGGGHDHAEQPIGRVFPGGPGGFQGPGNGPLVPGTRSRALLGVQTQAASGGQSGALIQTVQSGSPAEQAGLKAGDVITAIDGNAVASPEQLAAQVFAHQPGDQITVTYTRSGSSAQATAKLGTRSAPS